MLGRKSQIFGPEKQNPTFWLRYTKATLVAVSLPNEGCDVRNLSSCKKEIPLMLKYYIKASDLLERLRADKDGVVSFEYVIVAACVVAAVVAAFGTTSSGSITTALTNAIAAIVKQIPGAA